MTARELKQIRDLKKELKYLEGKIKSTNSANINKKLISLQKRVEKEEVAAIEFIANIPDSFTRRIFEYRYLEGYTYAKIAMRIGGGNTPDSVRKTAERYFTTIIESEDN